MAIVAAEAQRLTRGLAGLLEELWLQLALEELVAHALVDEVLERQRASGPDKRGRVVLRPCGPVGAEVARERLFPPHGTRDGEAIGASADTLR